MFSGCRRRRNGAGTSWSAAEWGEEEIAGGGRGVREVCRRQTSKIWASVTSVVTAGKLAVEGFRVLGLQSKDEAEVFLGQWKDLL